MYDNIRSLPASSCRLIDSSHLFSADFSWHHIGLIRSPNALQNSCEGPCRNYHIIASSLRGGELVEWLYCDIEPTTRAPLVPDPSDCSVDEQHWKVSGLATWGQCA